MLGGKRRTMEENMSDVTDCIGINMKRVVRRVVER